MVKRYTPDQNKPARYQVRGILLYILPFPLLPAALLALLNDNLKLALGSGLGFLLAMFAATLARKGISIEAQAKKRKIVRRSSTLPYKMLGAILLGVAMASTSMIAIGNGIIVSILLGIAAYVGFYLYYGFDPAREKPGVATIGITSEEVLELLEEAEARIAGIEEARAKIHNQELKDRLRRIVKQTRNILTTIEEDPRDARRARKFLKVYLDGAQQVTSGYARSHKQIESAELDDNFRRVLTTIESVIADQQKKLLENNATELDVQIEVLQMQLEKEGVT
jgi:5-bromo-4-chloroindolyl phosphate hydrolysis protein